MVACHVSPQVAASIMLVPIFFTGVARYNYNYVSSGGVDLEDQVMVWSNAKAKSRRWTMEWFLKQLVASDPINIQVFIYCGVLEIMREPNSYVELLFLCNDEQHHYCIEFTVQYEENWLQ